MIECNNSSSSGGDLIRSTTELDQSCYEDNRQDAADRWLFK